MRISVFFDHVREASEQTGLGLAEALMEARSFGITALECSLESLLEDVEGRKELFEKCDMRVSSVYAVVDFVNADSAESAYKLVDTAAEFGADKVLVVPGFVPIDGKYVSSPDEGEVAHGRRECLKKATRMVGTPQMENMARNLNELCEYAVRKGVTVTMEDYDDASAPFASDVQLKWFLDHVPELYICFDTGNFMYADVDELGAFELLKSRIRHVHLKDRSLKVCEGETPKETVTGKEMYASPVGKGCIHMEEIIHGLKEIGYDDTLAIEHFGALDQLEFMKESARWIKETI